MMGEGTDSKSDQQRRLRLGCHSFIASPVDCKLGYYPVEYDLSYEKQLQRSCGSLEKH